MVREEHIFRTILAGLILVGVVIFCTLQITAEPTDLVANPQQLRARNGVLSLTLRAALNSDGQRAFFFNGRPEAPTLRLSPGDQLKITYINDLPVKPKESCANTRCMDVTNLHFHGLEVSPQAPQDDVLTMMPMPGQSLRYTVQIPKDHAPGLYWYHAHPYGESDPQAVSRTSGAIVIEGIESYAPQLAGMPERVLVVRGLPVQDDLPSKTLKRRVELGSHSCGGRQDNPTEVFTVNGAIRPKLEIAPGEYQFWRVVNASSDRYVDLQLAGQMFEIVAMDGMPISEHDSDRPTRLAEHVLLPPGGRVEAIVRGPSDNVPRRLTSRCVDTGPDGDPNPEMVLADIVPKEASAIARVASSDVQPRLKILNIYAEEERPPEFVATFTEDQNGFYINGGRFDDDAAPVQRLKAGALQHWKIVNATRELHPMRMHQVHFLAYEENGVFLANPMWLDTVNVPYGGTVDVIVDLRAPVVHGMSVFHCHLPNHEDKGLMAKVLFE